jgi:hypothetical protein
MVQSKSIYDEVATLIVGSEPLKVINYKPSMANQKRLEFLLDKNKNAGLTVEEKTELEQYLLVNRIVGLAKAKALSLLTK